MAYKALITSWKWGLLSDETEEKTGRAMAESLLHIAKKEVKSGKLGSLGQVFRLFTSFPRQRVVYIGWRRGKRTMYEFWELFYRIILSGQSAEITMGALDEAGIVAVDRLDHEFIEVFKEQKGAGIQLGVLSVAFDYFIRSCLTSAGHSDLFDTIVANDIQQDQGLLSGITLDIYAEKPQFLKERFLVPLGIDAADVIYHGGSEQDYGIAEMLPEGNFIVSRHVPEEFRDKFVSEYGAFAPGSADELRQYLATRT